MNTKNKTNNKRNNKTNNKTNNKRNNKTKNKKIYGGGGQRLKIFRRALGDRVDDAQSKSVETGRAYTTKLRDAITRRKLRQTNSAGVKAIAAAAAVEERERRNKITAKTLAVAKESRTAEAKVRANTHMKYKEARHTERNINDIYSSIDSFMKRNKFIQNFNDLIAETDDPSVGDFRDNAERREYYMDKIFKNKLNGPLYRGVFERLIGNDDSVNGDITSMETVAETEVDVDMGAGTDETKSDAGIGADQVETRPPTRTD